MGARPDLDLGLSRVRRTLAALGHPERAFAAVHVAGTNGKGSTCALIEACLRAADPPLRVGRFVSPFLREPRDAVWVCGAPVTAEAWDAALARVFAATAVAEATEAAGAAGAADTASATAATAADVAGALTTFELWTAAAFLLFRDAALDVCVVEVGVGGATDATNALPPAACAVLTSICLDHVELLGPALSNIAAHKAGIIKAGGTAAVLAPGQALEVTAVVRARAEEAGVPLHEPRSLVWAAAEVGAPATSTPVCHCHAGRRHAYCRLALEQLGPDNSATAPALLTVPMPLRGSFQLINGSAALAALRALQRDPLRRFVALTDAAIVAGFAAVTWPGRLESMKLRPKKSAASLEFLVDGGHNEGAMPFVREAIDDILSARGGGSVRFVYACSASRQLSSVLPLLLRPGDALLAVPFSPPEGMQWVRPHAPAAIVQAVADAFGGAVSASACASLEEALAIVAAEVEEEAATGRPAVRLRVVCGSLYLVADVHRGGCIE